MKAKVTKAFPGVPDGETATRQIEPGEELSGDLAAVAVREGWAEETKAAAPRAVAPEDAQLIKSRKLSRPAAVVSRPAPKAAPQRKVGKKS